VAERDDAQERTEQATAKRLREAREQGRIARSRELNTLAMMVAAIGGLALLGPGIMDAMVRLASETLAPDPGLVRDPQRLLAALAAQVMAALHALWPLFGLLVATALLAPMALGGWSLSSQALTPRWDRLDPLKGLGRVFSVNGLIELVKAVIKLLVVLGAAVLWLWHQAAAFVGLGHEPFEVGIVRGVQLIGTTLFVLLLPLLLIAAIDVPYQLWQHTRQLRMTRREIKDEMKETEGNPDLRARIRRQQQALSRRRMMQRLPQADVVVTNPTHYAVALAYDEPRMQAPVLVAKGIDRLALKIREIARHYGIPTLEAPGLARALHHHTELEQPIPRGLYLAVAQVLAYVYRLRRLGAARAGRFDVGRITIPDELRRD
jgi:flagellar biosynthetic protein FlhB